MEEKKEKEKTRVPVCNVILAQQQGDATTKSPGDVQTIRWTVAAHLLWMRLLPPSLAGRDPPLRYLLFWASQSGKGWR